MLAEYRDNDCSDGQWKILPFEFKEDRHYCLFAILADVRNGINETRKKPISAPRGFPGDYSELKKEFMEEYLFFGPCLDGDGHSTSWLTFKEIFEYPDWDKPASDNVKTYREYCQYFLDELAECMKLGWSSNRAEEYRIVFNFDN
jgi:hypothetical protein